MVVFFCFYVQDPSTYGFWSCWTPFHSRASNNRNTRCGHRLSYLIIFLWYQSYIIKWYSYHTYNFRQFHITLIYWYGITSYYMGYIIPYNYLMLFVAKVSATSARTASNRRVFDGQANYLRWKNVRHKAPGATEEGVRTGGKVWHWTKKPCLGDFFDCPREFVQCQVRLRKDQWLILTNMWKFWHVCRRLVGDNLPLLCCVQHVGMGHDWISTGFLSQNGRQAALKMTQASSPQGLNVEM